MAPSGPSNRGGRPRGLRWYIYYDVDRKPGKRAAGKGSGRMTSDRRIRPGSRLLLGIALFAGTLASICGGALLADFALDLLGVASQPFRIVVKVIAMAVALPAGFFLVERAFLARSSCTTSRKTPRP